MAKLPFSSFTRSRVEAFSDGVFAIIVTLLVLELKVPKIIHPNSVDELSRALIVLLPKLLSWIISFFMVCVIWVNHHRLLNQITHITHGIFWFNALLLLWCSFIPFPTALVGDYVTNPVSAFVFGIVMALMALTFTLIRWQAQREPGVLSPNVNMVLYRKVTTQSLVVGPIFYSLGAVAAFISPWISLSLFGFIPFFFIFFNHSATDEE